MTLDKKNNKPNIESPMIDDTIAHQIDSPDFKDSDIQPEEPFTNKYGVKIGDSLYDSPNSPLNQWSIDTDPSIMAGDEWVHPTNDIGWNTKENKELAENKIRPQGVPFMHPTKDVSYKQD